MRKTGAWLLLATAWAGAGCINLPLLTSQPKPPEPPAPVVKPVREPEPVTADQVSEGNAHEMVQALRAELDRETLAEN